VADYNLVYRAVLTVTAGDSGITLSGGLYGKNFALPSAVKPSSTFINQRVAESRVPSLPEPTLTLEHRGAFVRLVNANTVRLEWKGALVTDPEAGPETISAYAEVYDLESVGDDIKEMLFRQQRALGYLGENALQDLIQYDDAGNMVTYRLRLFATADNASNATPDLPNGEDLETGELARMTMSQEILTSKNDRVQLIRLLTDLLATPGVD
jgi:hypothetical protein